MEKVNITIDGIKLSVPASYTILEAAAKNNIYIPRLCFLEKIHEESSCRVCVVEVEGSRNLKNACTIQVWDGMVVKTNTDRVINSVTENLKLTASSHNFECWKCAREDNCEFLGLLKKFDVENTYGEDRRYEPKDRIFNASSSIVIDSSKCVLCGRCVSGCEKLSGTSVLGFNQRGSKTYVGPALNHDIEDSGCIYCGKCIQSCPVAALTDKADFPQVEKILKSKEKFVVVQPAPAVRAALGEEFGLPIGTNVEGKMFAAFKELGFSEIADVNWAADLTIMEEGTEFIHRLNGDGPFPMFTSCSPGWIRYIEQYESDYIPNLSSAKSPHQMGGAMIKHYWSKKLGVEPKNIVVVSIMPCIAKKWEAARPELEYAGLRDVDYVLTTRELARMIKRANIDFVNLKDFKPQGELAVYTGAGNIFGATGGVMEAAVRTVVDVLEDKDMPQIDYKELRGVLNIKEATLKIKGKEINVAVVHGGHAIKEFFEILKKGKKKFHFVELMGCTGGCVNGGGQPVVTAEEYSKFDVRALRAKALYDNDMSLKIRKSHLNPSIQKAYKEFLGEPCGKKSHELLHTKFAKQDFYHTK
ncbi:MAG: NADH-dependent [FeFe] hydrogenase, group A6 [Erysipelotrichales bacterium]|nr:NADH-dependent [FeFe] hydrogenase, group A6 [Erysipelotrichales bacterium]